MKLPHATSPFWTVVPATVVCLSVLAAMAKFSTSFDQGEVMVALAAFGSTYATCEAARQRAKADRRGE